MVKKIAEVAGAVAGAVADVANIGAVAVAVKRTLGAVADVAGSLAVGKASLAVALVAKFGAPVLVSEQFSKRADITGQKGMTFGVMFGTDTKVHNLGADCIGRACLDNGILDWRGLELGADYTPSKRMVDKLGAAWARQEIRHAERIAKQDAPSA